MTPLPNPWIFAALDYSPSPPAETATAGYLSAVAASSTVETFSAYAARRCKDKISPPIEQPKREYVPDFDALYDAITWSHPRDLDNDPPPVFLRSPSPAFLQTLFHLAGVK